MTLAAKIVIPCAMILVLAIACLEGAVDCKGDLAEVLSLPLHPKAPIATSASTLLVMASQLVLYCSAVFFIIYSLHVIRSRRRSGKATPMIVLAIALGASGAIGMLMAAPPATFGLCYGQEYFFTPMRMLAKYLPGHPMLTPVMGVQVGSLMFFFAVVLVKIAFWALAVALASVLPSHKDEVDDVEQYISQAKEAMERLFVCGSVFFVICVFAISLWLRLPWDALAGGEQYYRYPSTLSIYYGLVVSFLIITAYLIASQHLRSVARRLTYQESLPDQTQRPLLYPDFEFLTEFKRFSVLLGPLWSAFLPIIAQKLT